MSKRILVTANSDWLLAHFRLPLLRALEEHGLEVVLICPEGDYVDQLQEEGFDWRPWNMRRKSISPFWVLTALLELIHYYQKFQPAAVHQITIQPIFYGSMAARLSGVPVVINNFTGLGFLFSASKQAFWLRKFTLPILRWAVDRRGVFSVLLNEQDRQELVDRQLIPRDRSRIIPGDGVDLDRFHPPVDKNAHQGAVTVLMAARLLWDKGVGDYLQAAEAVQEEIPGVQFWLAGAPDPGNPTSIPEEKIQYWKQQGTVEFLGYRKDMAFLLSEADLAVLPSYHEGVPVFLMEAAAAGLPLIATDLEGCRLIIQEGKNGLLVPTGDVGRLVEALLALIRQPALRKRMGLKSREIVEREFGQGHIVSQFVELYRSLGLLPGKHRQDQPGP